MTVLAPLSTIVLKQGDVMAAERYAIEAVELSRGTGWEASALVVYGEALAARGDLASAEAATTRALSVALSCRPRELVPNGAPRPGGNHGRSRCTWGSRGPARGRAPEPAGLRVRSGDLGPHRAAMPRRPRSRPLRSAVGPRVRAGPRRGGRSGAGRRGRVWSRCADRRTTLRTVARPEGPERAGTPAPDLRRDPGWPDAPLRGRDRGVAGRGEDRSPAGRRRTLSPDLVLALTG